METFIKVIDDTPFEFTGILEGKEEACRVRTDLQDFKMTVGHERQLADTATGTCLDQSAGTCFGRRHR